MMLIIMGSAEGGVEEGPALDCNIRSGRDRPGSHSPLKFMTLEPCRVRRREKEEERYRLIFCELRVAFGTVDHVHTSVELTVVSITTSIKIMKPVAITNSATCIC